MARLIVYYAHPAPRHSRANAAMKRAGEAVSGITWVDLYAEYPRFDIDPDREQARLVDHDVILFQFPFFWYSAPSIVKEWMDIVLEHGFAYGAGETALTGKQMMLAVTASGTEDAYSERGYQNLPLHCFLTPYEQTAALCKMRYETPLVLYSALKSADDGRLARHATAYAQMLAAIRDGDYDFETARQHKVVHGSALTGLMHAPDSRAAKSNG
jgi:putative NADPH-quinone reductase